MAAGYDIEDLVRIYRETGDTLKMIRENHYKRGLFVKVESPRFTGIGFIGNNSETPPDQLSVTLSNGNTWNYPLEDIIEIINPESNEISSELKQLHSRFKFKI